jgi:shikimate 5-dehydrogenase
MADISVITKVAIQAADETGPATDSAARNIGRVGAAASGMGVDFRAAADALKNLGMGEPLAGIEGLLHGIGGAAGAASLAIVGAAAAVLALAKSEAESVNQLRILTAQAGTTVERFLALKTMAAEAGVEGEKMAMMVSALPMPTAAPAIRSKRWSPYWAQSHI